MKTLFLAVVLFFIVSVSRAQQSIHDTLPEMIPMQTLDEITVRPQYIRHQNNHYTIQVSPAEKGKNGEDLLRQAPGIWLSQGKISINGSSGTRVFIDGREIRLEGELFTNYLQSLKSEDIARIEVYPVAGAEHDANMKGGIIERINREKRNSKNYILFLGSTGTESNQAPCLSLVQFQIEQGELVMTAYQRSSDANLGLPADIYHLYLISRQIELPLKSITLNLGNVHIYENNIDKTEQLLAGNENVKFELNV